MNAPKLAEDPDLDAEPEPDTEPEPEGDSEAPEPAEAPDEDELDPAAVDVAEATVDEDDLDGGLFSGTEDAEDDAEDEDTDPEFTDYADAVGEGPSGGPSGHPGTEAIETAINEGAARLAVVGLDDTEQGELQAEMEDVFGAFRLGHFGANAAEQHVFSEGENIDPVWGFLGASLVCGAFALHMRPDGEEQLANIRGALGLTGGDSA
jgi:hypothetical protein